MKKLVLLLLVTISFVCHAQQEIDEGVVVFKQTMSSDNEQMNAQFAMIGELVTTTYFKVDKSRTELSNPFMGEVVTIFDTESGQTLMTMNSPAIGKLYTSKAFSDVVGQNEGVDIKKGAESKTFLGYDCQQYIFTMTQEGVDVEMVMFTTDKIKAIKQETLEFMQDFDGGFPLYIEIKTKNQGMMLSIVQEATSINSEKVEDSKFDLKAPEGFTKVDSMPGM